MDADGAFAAVCSLETHDSVLLRYSSTRKSEFHRLQTFERPLE